MNQRHPLLAAAQVVILACGFSLAAHAADTEKKLVDVIFKGDAKCTGCHDENDNAPVFAIGKTKHGVAADGRNIGCIACHGESKLHAENPQGLKNRPKVDRGFLKNTTTPVATQNAGCLTCHDGGNRMHWASSQHAGADLSCSSCHKVHTQHDKVRDKVAQGEVCFTCHKEQRAQTHRMSTHPIKAGGVACSNCHNPHGSTGPKLLVKNTVNETCYTCHAEKRGPFLWEHPPASDDCMNCHTPHGSNNTALLKNRPPFLCSSCHIADGHSTQALRSGQNLGSGVVTGGAASGGQPNAAAQMVGKACLNCHTQVHGSNHPSGPRYVR